MDSIKSGLSLKSSSLRKDAKPKEKKSEVADVEAKCILNRSFVSKSELVKTTYAENVYISGKDGQQQQCVSTGNFEAEFKFTDYSVLPLLNKIFRVVGTSTKTGTIEARLWSPLLFDDKQTHSIEKDVQFQFGFPMTAWDNVNNVSLTLRHDNESAVICIVDICEAKVQTAAKTSDATSSRSVRRESTEEMERKEYDMLKSKQLTEENFNLTLIILNSKIKKLKQKLKQSPKEDPDIKKRREADKKRKEESGQFVNPDQLFSPRQQIREEITSIENDIGETVTKYRGQPDALDDKWNKVRKAYIDADKPIPQIFLTPEEQKERKKTQDEIIGRELAQKVKKPKPNVSGLSRQAQDYISRIQSVIDTFNQAAEYTENEIRFKKDKIDIDRDQQYIDESRLRASLQQPKIVHQIGEFYCDYIEKNPQLDLAALTDKFNEFATRLGMRNEGPFASEQQVRERFADVCKKSFDDKQSAEQIEKNLGDGEKTISTLIVDKKADVTTLKRELQEDVANIQQLDNNKDRITDNTLKNLLKRHGYTGTIDKLETWLDERADFKTKETFVNAKKAIGEQFDKKVATLKEDALKQRAELQQKQDQLQRLESDIKKLRHALTEERRAETQFALDTQKALTEERVETKRLRTEHTDQEIRIRKQNKALVEQKRLEEQLEAKKKTEQNLRVGNACGRERLEMINERVRNVDTLDKLIGRSSDNEERSDLEIEREKAVQGIKSALVDSIRSVPGNSHKRFNLETMTLRELFDVYKTACRTTKTDIEFDEDLWTTTFDAILLMDTIIFDQNCTDVTKNATDAQIVDHIMKLVDWLNENGEVVNYTRDSLSTYERTGLANILGEMCKNVKTKLDIDIDDTSFDEFAKELSKEGWGKFIAKTVTTGIAMMAVAAVDAGPSGAGIGGIGGGGAESSIGAGATNSLALRFPEGAMSTMVSDPNALGTFPGQTSLATMSTDLAPYQFTDAQLNQIQELPELVKVMKITKTKLDNFMKVYPKSFQLITDIRDIAIRNDDIVTAKNAQESFSQTYDEDPSELSAYLAVGTLTSALLALHAAPIATALAPVVATIGTVLILHPELTNLVNGASPMWADIISTAIASVTPLLR